MSAPCRSRVSTTIHLAALAAGGVGGGLAQLPCVDAAPLVVIQLAMLHSIAKHHGRKLTDAAAEVLLATFTTTIVGRTTSQLLFGWVPVLGNITNAATAASLTEGVGWAADRYFSELSATTTGGG